jgi:general secretion pathway protein A
LVRQFDLPAVLELADASGTLRFFALTAVDGDAAIFEFGPRRETVPIAEVEREWHGSFVMLWKPPRVGIEAIGPGTAGADVLWLRQRLASLDGRPLPAVSDARIFDDTLAARVLAFQRAERLGPDGIAGFETLAKLSTLVDPAAPSLARARTGS